MRKILSLIAILVTINVTAQEVTNVHAKQSGDMAIINYDIVGATSANNYLVKIYSSIDGGNTFGKELYYVSGDVGPNVIGGSNKTIKWYVKKERSKLVGEVVFKVEAISSVKMPDPASSNNCTMTLTSCRRNGSNIIFEYNFISKNDKLTHMEKSGSYAYDNYGNKYELGSFMLNGKSFYDSKNLIRNVLYKGEFTIEGFDNEKEIIAKLHINGFNSYHDYEFRNITMP